MVGVFPSNDQGKDGGAMISRRDLALLALIPTIYLAACCAVNALDAGPSIATRWTSTPADQCWRGSY